MDIEYEGSLLTALHEGGFPNGKAAALKVFQKFMEDNNLTLVAGGFPVADVKKFREAFNLPVHYTPTKLPTENVGLHVALLQEEVSELQQAMLEGNHVEVLDAVVDIIYIALGAAWDSGIGFLVPEAHQIIHASNMSKLGDDGKPIYREDGKVLKGPNYKAPTEELLKLFGEDDND